MAALISCSCPVIDKNGLAIYVICCTVYLWRSMPCSYTHRCQPLLGVNLSPEFVNLYFPYAVQGLLFFRWYYQC